MKLLQQIPKLSIKASPPEISQDIGQFSVITIDAHELGCKDYILINLKLSGEGKIGTDFLLYHKPLYSIINYRNLTTDDQLIQVYIFNNNPILQLYLFPINYGSLTNKKVTIDIVDEPGAFFSKIRSTSILLKRSLSLYLDNNVDTYSPVISGGIFDKSSEVSAGDTYLNISPDTYPTLDLTSPSVQFSQSSISISEGLKDQIILERNGDLSQNSVVRIQLESSEAKLNIDYTLYPDMYLIFYAGESSKEITLKSILDQLTEPIESLSLRVSPYINSVIGSNSTINIDIT